MRAMSPLAIGPQKSTLSFAGTTIRSPLKTIPSTMVSSWNTCLYCCTLASFVSIQSWLLHFLSACSAGSSSVASFTWFLVTALGVLHVTT